MPIPVHIETFKRSAHLQDSMGAPKLVQLRPVGVWRFLTPFDHVQVGDLYRCITVEPPYEDDSYQLAFRFGWSLVHKTCGLVDELYQGRELEQYEVIRAVDESGTYEPMFELPK